MELPLPQGIVLSIVGTQGCLLVLQGNWGSDEVNMGTAIIGVYVFMYIYIYTYLYIYIYIYMGLVLRT